MATIRRTGQRLGCVAVLVSLAISLGVPIDQSLAVASTAPTVRLRVPHDQVRANAPFEIGFSSARLPADSTLVIQQRRAGARLWKTVRKLDRSSGTTTLPGRPMGAYEYRITAIAGGTAVAASAARPLRAYGDITMTTLCGVLHAPCSGGSEAIGTKVFAFAEGLNARGATYPHFETILGASHTTCRSAVIEFATYTPGHPGEAYLRLVQHESEPEPEEASTSASTVTTDDIALNGGPWSLQSSSSNGNNNVFNGTFSCYTPTGL